MDHKTEISNVVFSNGEGGSIQIADGKITSFRAAGTEQTFGRDTVRIDGQGALALPGLIDGHLHLDKTFVGDVWKSHLPHSGESRVKKRVALEKQIRATSKPVRERAEALLEQAIALGTSYMRSHVDVDADVGLANIEAVLDVRDRYKHAITIEIVAFPQSGILSSPGTNEFLEQAVCSGADLVGGLDPAGYDGDQKAHLDIVFGIAERRDVGVDIHLHDGGMIGIAELEDIAARSKATGMHGRVAVSHAFALGEVPLDQMLRTADKLRDAGVAIMTSAPTFFTFPRVLPLRKAGVTVFAGNDNIRDAWSPYGSGDMLERAMLIGYRSGFYTDDELAVAFDLVTEAASKAMNLDHYGLKVGGFADIVLVNAAHIPEAVVGRPDRELVMKRGAVVAKNGLYCA